MNQLEALERRLGPRRLGEVLLEHVRRRFAAGELEAGARALAAVLNAGPPAAPATLLGSVQAALAGAGWTLRSRTRGRRLRFAVRRAAADRDLLDLAAEAGGAAATDSARSIGPVFRLGIVSPLPRGLSAVEREGLESLLPALGLLLESLWGQDQKRDVLARAEIHEGSHTVDDLLRTTLACNQRCVFCFVPRPGRAVDLTEIERELDGLARSRGTQGELTFSGGEPTADPRLARVLEAARARGFRDFGIQTNAVLLERALLDRLIALGVKTYMVSFHSHRPRLYDAITGSRGLYPRAVAGLTRLIHDPRCHVTVNIVVHTRNYRDLPGWVRFLGRLAAGLPPERRLAVYLSMLNEAGHEKFPAEAVSLERVSPYLRRAVALCRHYGLEVVRFGGESSFPACLLEDPARHAVPREFPQGRVRYAEDFSGEVGTIGRAKRPGCKTCDYDSRCVGVPVQYACQFGLGALQPCK